MKNMVFIPGNVPSSKSGKIKGIFLSKQCQDYLKSLGIKTYSSRDKSITGYSRRAMTFPIAALRNNFYCISQNVYPIIIGFHFIRKRNGAGIADFNNLTHILADLMTAGGVIPDDRQDYCYFVPMPINGRYFTVDKVKPGVWIDRVNINVTSYSESEVENEQVD